MADDADTYPKPVHGWTCFHCGETFTTYGGARDHFGADQLKDPACRIKVGEERGLVMALRRAEGHIDRLQKALEPFARAGRLSGIEYAGCLYTPAGDPRIQITAQHCIDASAAVDGRKTDP